MIRFKKVKRAVAPTVVTVMFALGLMPSKPALETDTDEQINLAAMFEPPTPAHKKTNRPKQKNKQVPKAPTIAHRDTHKLDSSAFNLSAVDFIAKTCDISHRANLVKLLAEEPEIFRLMLAEGEANKIPFTVWFRVIDKESGYLFVNNASGSGAKGYCQVMPRTFRHYEKVLKLTDGHTKPNNIRVGARLLRDNANRYLAKNMSPAIAWARALKDYSGGNAPLAAKEMARYEKHGDEMALYATLRGLLARNVVQSGE
jgi:soluble lytic murein transglycosylase-like protein